MQHLPQRHSVIVAGAVLEVAVALVIAVSLLVSVVEGSRAAAFLCGLLVSAGGYAALERANRRNEPSAS